MTSKKLIILLGALALAGCASAPGGGHSATSTVIDGVDVWKGGPPSRPYQVIGYTGREGADGSTNYADEEASIAAEARSRGADGIIVVTAVMAVSRMSPIDSHPILAPKVRAELIKYN